MKKYSLSELDQLRHACEMRYLYGTTNVGMGGMISRPTTEESKYLGVESLVRIYMSAGITAEDIYKEDGR